MLYDTADKNNKKVQVGVWRKHWLLPDELCVETTEFSQQKHHCISQALLLLFSVSTTRQQWLTGT
jgi:inner membrane protein involved in colicin E2 resistance